MSLGRKQSITNDAWLEAVATVESAVSEEALGELVSATIEDIRAKTAGKGRPTPGAQVRTVLSLASSARRRA